MAKLYRSRELEAAVRRWCLDRLEGWSVPHTTTIVPTTLGDTHVTSLGEGVDTCLYLPGTNFNAATSTGLLASLAGQCRVMCPDLPGQPGLSSAGRPSEETQSYARWVAELLGDVDTSGRIILMGHSRGAAVALSAPPEAVDALILLSPAGLAKVRVTPSILLRSAGWLLRPNERRSLRLVEMMTGAPAGPELRPVVEWLTLVARSTRTTGAPGPLDDELIERWQGKQTRVLVGDHDPFFPPSRLRRPVQERLGTRLEVLAGTGHLLVDQRADAVSVVLATELERGRTT